MQKKYLLKRKNKMSSITKLCVVCVAEEHDPEEAELLDDYDLICFNCHKPIGARYGEEVYLLWRSEEEGAASADISAVSVKISEDY